MCRARCDDTHSAMCRAEHDDIYSANVPCQACQHLLYQYAVPSMTTSTLPMCLAEHDDIYSTNMPCRA